MAQLMPLPLTVSCFSKIQIGFTFLVPAHPGSPGKRAVKWYVGDDGLTLTVINLCKKKTLKVLKKCVIRSSICKKKEPDTCEATLPCSIACTKPVVLSFSASPATWNCSLLMLPDLCDEQPTLC